MGTPLKKVSKDFRGQKLRTAIVIVSIMVGVFCITGVDTISAVVTTAFTNSITTTHVADIAVDTAAPTSSALLSTISGIPNVTRAEARAVFQTRWRVHTTWFTMKLTGIESFAGMRVGQITLNSGRYPRAGQVMLEYSTLQVLSTKVGQTVRIQGNRGVNSYTVSGYGKNIADAPAFLSGISEGFMPLTAVQQLSGIQGVNQFLVNMRTFDKKDATVKAIRAVFQQRNLRIARLTVRDPNHFVVLDTFKSLTELLTIFGIVALVLSGMLVINTLNTVVSEQTPQIGTMKAVGASAGQIIRTYLTLGLLYGLSGTAFGLIVGILGAYEIVQKFAAQSGQSVPGIVISPLAIVEGILIGIGITLVASFLPVWAGSRITVREAISSYGIGTGYKQSRLDALVGALGFLSRPARMSVRNTFRRRMRLLLTLVPLALAGSLFLAVGSVVTSLNHAVDAVSSANRADVVVSLAQGGKIAKVKSTVEHVTGVAGVEAWYQIPATVAGKEGVILSGVPAHTHAYRVSLSKGRWIAGSDINGVVLSDAFARDNNLSVGQLTTIQAPSGVTQQWRIIGTVKDQSNNGSAAFAPRAQVQDLGRAPGTTNYLLVTGTQHSHQAITGLINRLGDALFPLGIQPSFTRVTDLNTQIKSQFTIFTVLFYTIVAIVAIVGALGLFAVLTMNVVERRKEIGVMRSIGASSLDVVQVFTVEGLAVGLIASVTAVILGVPVGLAFTLFISKLLIQIDFSFSLVYVVLMLVFMLLVAAISSIVPAASAARLKIADVLRYG